MGDDLRFVSSAYLLASHDYLNQKCQSASDAFMRCKAKDQDPAACYKLGNELSACGAKMLKLLQSKCGEQFDNYAECLDVQGISLSKCAKQKEIFNDCAKRL
jgi:NADH dehydrogenase (ubiquinone) 1 alpha subcomplex subunit 8